MPMHIAEVSYRKIRYRKILLRQETLQQSYATQKVKMKPLTELIDNSKLKQCNQDAADSRIQINFRQ